MENNKLTARELHDKFVDTLIEFAALLLDSRESAEDVVYEMFAEMFKRGDEFDSEKDARPFMYVTVRRKCYNILRHQKVVRLFTQHSKEDPELFYNLNETEETEMLIQEQLLLIYDQVEQLPHQTRIIMKEYWYGGKSMAQIAADLSITTKTVQNQLALGKDRVKKAILKSNNKLAFPKRFQLLIFCIVQLLKYLLDND